MPRAADPLAPTTPAPTTSVPVPTSLPAIGRVDPGQMPACEAVVIGTVQTDRGVKLAAGAAPVDAVIGGRLTAALRALRATGAAGEVLVLPTLGLAPFEAVIATGLGRDHRDAETLRRAAGAATRAARRYRTVHVALDGPLDAIVEGAALGSYDFIQYKSGAQPPALRRITVAAAAGAATRSALHRARVVATAVATVRDLVNTPPNELYPATFAERAVALAEAAGLAVTVLDPKALAREGYGGLLAVGSGSARSPRLVRLHYRPAGRVAGRVALIGKGITFDSGGLNLKTANLTWMKSDMAGAAAMLASTVAAAQLRLPIEVITTVPMAENMPGGSAYRPSDVLTMRSGRTVEVTNTDAEGRLVLADAISRALEDEPDWLIEASTLTGAQLVALGTRVIGAMGEPGLRDLVTAAGNAVGESVWAMPLPDELRAGLDSPVADLINSAEDRWGGMLVGGHFLADFLADAGPWVHLDIAGPAWNAGAARDYTPQGGTGAAVRTVLASLERLALS
jgi:leucyl aminopeptidase